MKRINQEIKKYLRKFINYNQNDWTELVTFREYVYNTRTSKKEDFISYQLVYRETSEIITKKKKIRVYNKIIR